ncbi:MAG: cysteine hydrolase, partial [Thermoleophilaceae bacterium]|nr:cysteine hydrolase [Thermoleophilaceae bacterium]
VAHEVSLLKNLRLALDAARRRGMPVVYAPHERYRRKASRRVHYPNPSQFMTPWARFFAAGRRGGRFRADLAPGPGEFVASEHAVASGFGGTNLDAHLRQIGATDLVVCGLLTNTCVESTVRHAVDLGYRVTVLSDGVAAWSHEDHDAAMHCTLPRVAHEIVTTSAFVSSLA